MRKRFISRFEWYSVLGPEFLFVGHGLNFWYPTHNRFGVPPEYTQRSIAVTKIQCLRDVGVAAEWIKRQPLVRRGSWLVTGFDVELDEERSFYWEAMHHRRVRDSGVGRPNRSIPPPPPRRPFPLPGLRLGFHDPSDAGHGLIDWMNRPFRPTRRDRLQLRQVLMDLEEATVGQFDHLQLSAFPVKL